MIWKDPIHTVPVAERLLPGADFPPGTEKLLAEQKPRPTKNPRRDVLYVCETLEAVATLLANLGPNVDSALHVDARYLGTSERKREWVAVAENEMSVALRKIDLLVVTNVPDASKEDLRYLAFILSTRRRGGLITVVDSMDGLTAADIGYTSTVAVQAGR